MRHILRIASVVALLIPASGLVWGTNAYAQRAKQRARGAGAEQLTAESVQEMTLRAVGPTIIPGRVADIAVDGHNPHLWYLATSSSGLWRTTNHGIDWEPIFDHEGSYSLGCVVIDPGNSDVVWLGTGENSSNRSVGYGNGIYKSTDGGKTWKNMGLRDSQHIGRILVDPRNSDVVFVAAEGPLWAPGGERGLYKTTDGGQTWKAVLQIGENTGVTDLAFDPRNPDVVYASSYQRRRHVGLLIGGGPESAIYKTTDGGASWKKLTNDMPTADVGRIALAVSPQKPDVVYALIYAAKGQGGFFRSEDRGETWTRQCNYAVIDPQYYGEIYPDPHQFDRVYIIDSTIHVTDDGGKTCEPTPWRIHVDHHAMYLDPADKNHLFVGNDGGLYESCDHGETWHHFLMPTSQFYRVAVDDSRPFYYLYGGTQDNGSVGGPSRTAARVGIRASDWIVTGGGDGFQSRVDPEEQNIVYSMSQNAGLLRLDKRTGVSAGIRPNSDPNARWHWDSPLMICPHCPTRVYLAGNRLYRSDDRGDHWQAVSPDLTRQLDPDHQLVMGRYWDKDAVQKNQHTTPLSVCSALDESPRQEGLLYIGTDDGLIQVSEDAGQNWRRIEQFPGIPDWAYVSDIRASQHDTDTVYASFNNYQRGDFHPYLLKSRDRGRTWTSIASDLPANYQVWCVVEDYENPDLLFAGTEFGLFFTVDGGRHWVQLKNGAPTIPFRDLTVQRRESDLVAATFGRSFYVLDDYTPLRYLTPQTLAEPATLFRPRDTLVYEELRYVVAAFGNPTMANPPFGAALSYYLGPKFASGNGGTLALVITDTAGKRVCQLAAPTTPGLHRVQWDLRREPPAGSDQSSGSRGRRGGRGRPSAPLVEPGTYTIALTQTMDGNETILGRTQALRVKPL